MAQNEFQLAGSILGNIATINRAFEGPSSSSEITALRFQRSEEDRALATSNDLVYGEIVKAYKVANDFAEFSTTGRRRDPETFRRVVDQLAASGLGDAANPFFKDAADVLLEGPSSNLVKAFGGEVSKQLRNNLIVQTALKKGGRFEVATNRMLQKFEGNVSNLVNLESRETAGFSGTGVPQTDVEVTEKLFNLVPGTATKGGDLIEVSNKSAKGIVQTVRVPDGKGGTQQVIVGSLTQAARQLLRVYLDNSYKEGAFRASQIGEGDDYETLLDLDKEQDGIQTMVDLLKGALDSHGKDPQELGDLAAKLEAAEIKFSEDGTSSRMNQNFQIARRSLADGQVLIDEEAGKYFRNLTGQVTAKTTMFSTMMKDLSELVGRFQQEQTAGTIPLPRLDDPNIDRILQQLPPEFFADEVLHVTELTSFLQRFGDTVATGGGRESLSFRGMTRDIFGREVAEGDDLKGLIAFNDIVNKRFTDFVEGNIKELNEGKKGDPLERAQAKRFLAEAELGEDRAKVTLEIRRESPFLIRESERVALRMGLMKEVILRVYAGAFEGILPKGALASLQLPENMRKFDILPTFAIPELLKGNAGNAGLVKEYGEILFDELIRTYGARIVKLTQQEAQGGTLGAAAKKEKARMAKELGPSLLQSYVNTQEAYLKVQGALKSTVDKLNQKEKSEEGLNAREKNQRTMIFTLQEYYGDEDAMGALLLMLGLKPSKLENARGETRRFNDALRSR